VSLLAVWVVYAIIGCFIFTAVLLWAVRSRQFTDLDRQRYIALKAAALPETDGKDRAPGFLDRYTWLIIVLIFLGLIARFWSAAR